MKKKKVNNPIGKRYFCVRESIFNRRVHIFLNYSRKEFAKWAQKQGDKDYVEDKDGDNNFAGFSSEIYQTDKPMEWVIVLKSFDWKIKEQGTLIHEIVHTIIKIWRNNNIPYNTDTQEFLAHSISNLYEDIAAKIFREYKTA